MIVLISTPVMESLRFPATGIYALKAILNLNSFVNRCFDLSKETFNKFGEEQCKNIDAYLMDYSKDENFDTLVKTFYRKFLIKKVKPLNPEWIGISIFSNYNFKSSVILSKIIREEFPHTKIILGGSGIIDSIPVGIKYDFWIKGDAEESLIELLKTNKQPEFKRLKTNLDFLPFPDYSDYKKDFGNPKEIMITGSRGCIYNCTPCDTKSYWKTFSFRSPENIIQEILYNKDLYNIKAFLFSDSLINGNMTIFRNLLKLLCKVKIPFGGHLSVRKEFTVEDFQLMAEANFKAPVIGIESMSNKVRSDMSKFFSNKTIYFMMDNLIAQKISPYLLFLVSYPTETEKDFQKTINFLKHYSDAAKRLNITVGFGPTLFIFPNTPLGDLDIWYQKNKMSKLFWKSTVVPNLDFPERVRRRKILSTIAKELGYVLIRDEEQQTYLKKKLIAYKEL